MSIYQATYQVYGHFFDGKDIAPDATPHKSYFIFEAESGSQSKKAEWFLTDLFKKTLKFRKVVLEDMIELIE